MNEEKGLGVNSMAELDWFTPTNSQQYTFCGTCDQRWVDRKANKNSLGDSVLSLPYLSIDIAPLIFEV